MRFSTRQSIKLFCTAVFVGVLGLIPAQAKSDFSGTWKIDVSKSDFGPLPAPDSVTEKIVHQDPSIKINLAQTGGFGDVTADLSYTTDGSECSNKIGENEAKSTLKWDGDDLVIDTKGSFGGTDYTSKDRWTLSSDGKTMTVTRHINSSMGEAEMKEVFAKQ